MLIQKIVIEAVDILLWQFFCVFLVPIPSLSPATKATGMSGGGGGGRGYRKPSVRHFFKKNEIKCFSDFTEKVVAIH